MTLDDVDGELQAMDIAHHQEWLQELADRYHRRVLRERRARPADTGEPYGPPIYGALGAEREG